MGKKKANPRNRPATQADVKNAKRAAQEKAIHTAFAIFFTCLHDKEGWGMKRMARLWDHVNDLSDSVAKGYVTVADLEKMLAEEVGITLGGCRTCPLRYGKTWCIELQDENPWKAVQLVADWTERHPVEGSIGLTAMERQFVRIYVDKGYIGVALDKSGELGLDVRLPKRGADLFTSTSLTVTVNSSRTVCGYMLPGITWENSPACLPKLIELEG